MNSTSVPQWGYKRSAGVNLLRDQIVSDMADLEARVKEIKVSTPIGWTGYFWIRSANGPTVEVSGDGWQCFDLTGAHVLKTDGTNPGTYGTVASQTYDNITVSGITLSAGDRIRIEKELPATDFFQVDLDVIDYGDTYL